jgi:hypothetical protein
MPRTASWRALLLLLLLAAAPGARAEPAKVKIGAHLIGLSSINFSAGTFAAHLWVWTLTSAPDIEPLKTLYVVNEGSSAADAIGTDRVEGQRWYYRRLRVVARTQWRLEHFPFDRQTLEIVFEESFGTTDDIIYVADSENSGLAPGIAVPGWRIAGWKVRAEEHAYTTNFGHPSKPPASKSARFIVSVEIERIGFALFLERTLGAFVAFGILALTFRMNASAPPVFAGRMVVTVASVFTVVVSLRGGDPGFAHAFGATLSDRIHLITLGFGFLAAIAAVSSRALVELDREAAAKRLDRWLLAAFAGLYAVLVGFLLIRTVA